MPFEHHMEQSTSSLQSGRQPDGAQSETSPVTEEAGSSWYRTQLLPGSFARAQCDVTIPYDVDRANDVSLPALIRLFELARGAAAVELDWGGLGSLFNSKPWLVKAQEMLVDSSPSAPNGPTIHPQAEATVEMEVSAIGERSFVLRSSLMDKGSGKRLVLHRCSCICTEFEESTGKRRSAALPQEFRDAHRSIAAPGKTRDPAEWPERLRATDLGGAAGIWTSRVKVMASDTDINGHVNNTVYVRYALDATADAARAGRLVEFPGDVAGRRVRAVQIQYDREAFWGDELEVRLSRKVSTGASGQYLTLAFQIQRPSSDDLLLALGTVSFEKPDAPLSRL